MTTPIAPTDVKKLTDRIDRLERLVSSLAHNNKLLTKQVRTLKSQQHLQQLRISSIERG